MSFYTSRYTSAYSHAVKSLILLVGGTGFEPVTPAV